MVLGGPYQKRRPVTENSTQFSPKCHVNIDDNEIWYIFYLGLFVKTSLILIFNLLIFCWSDAKITQKGYMMTEVVGLSHVKACRLSVSTDEVIVPSKKYQ